MDGIRTLRIAAVQMESRNGAAQANREKATGMVEEAAERGARLIALPEFMPNGYVFAKEIWDTAEPWQGPTLAWMRKTSRRLGVWLGCGFLEAEGEDFFNDYVITDPAGEVAGRVRKQTPAFAETYYTRGEKGDHAIRTELGRIGVGICYENMLAFIPRLMQAGGVDLVLMPHSAPSPSPSLLFPAAAVKAFDRGLGDLAEHYSRLLGVPVAMVNKCGPWRSPVPFLPFLKQDSSFPGLSAIADSDGRVKAQLGAEEGVLVEEVTLDPARKTGMPPACRGRWARDVHWAMNQFRLVEACGKAYYALSGERKRRAKEVSRTAL